MKTNKNQQAKKAKQMCVFANYACAVFMLLIMCLYFVDFVSVTVNGQAYNNTNGFSLAFILFGEIPNSNALSLVDGGAIQFASIMSLLCLVGVVALAGIFIVRAITKKTILSRHVILVGAIVIFLFVLQTVAVSGLVNATKANADPTGCCVVDGTTYNFIALITLLVFGAVYYVICEKMHTKYGIGFPEN